MMRLRWSHRVQEVFKKNKSEPNCFPIWSLPPDPDPDPDPDPVPCWTSQRSWLETCLLL